MVICLFLSAAAYGLGLSRLWSKAGAGHGIPGWRVACFGSGWLSLGVALVSPLDTLGGLLFSAHMVQHEMLMVVAAPLLVLSRPLAVWVWALPPAMRRGIGGVVNWAPLAMTWHLLTKPLNAWALHGLVLWGWHVPAMFEAALASQAVHTLQHVSFLGSALFFWWSPLGTGPARHGSAMLYVFTTMVHTALLGALLTFAPTPWYPSYGATASALGFDPLDDQQVGGLVMWVPGGLAYLIVGLSVAARVLNGGRGMAFAAHGGQPRNTSPRKENLMASIHPPTSSRPLALVTGASSGIGFQLARQCAQSGFDLLIAADDPQLDQAAQGLAALGVHVRSVQVDLATRKGVDDLHAAAEGRPIDALLANAGQGLGQGFLEQDFDDVCKVIDTNIVGTLYLLQKVAKEMRARGSGRILITGSIAGFMPGTFQAVYNGSKAFIDSFSWALREELKDSGVTVTCLMPGPTDTNFFERAGLMDTEIGQGKKDDPAEVARVGFEAMMAGEGDVVSGLKNKVQVAMAGVTPSAVLAEQHRKMAEPGGANRH
ncbi:MAG: SDR family NAD(P)-dependent oxidoreductase [Aquabacterium sp.]